MVVCKCRKATKLYCFVHKVPVCGECICYPEHQICVVRTYADWVIDGEYDWPPRCCSCQSVLEEGTGSQTTRLGCLHVTHTNCLVSHIKSFPPHTAPAGYVCPSCSTSIWPPKTVKDSGSRLHLKLKEAIMQTGLEKNLFGNHPVSLPSAESRAPPPAFASDPLFATTSNGDGEYNVSSSHLMEKYETNTSQRYSAATGAGSSKLSVKDIVDIDGPSSAENYAKNPSPVGVRGTLVNFCYGSDLVCYLFCILSYSLLLKYCDAKQPGATTRKGAFHVDRQNSEMSYYADDDEDGNHKKYSRRGPFRHKFLRALLPFWSSALPTLPVTAPPRKDGDDAAEGRVRHQRPSRMDPRKILLFIAIMACMATMGILYYRLAQRGFGEEQPEDEQQ